MVSDVYELVRADHTDLDLALKAMIDPKCGVDELVELLDVFRLALAVHVAAESKMFAKLVADLPAPQVLRRIATRNRDEHVEQERACDALGRTPPGTEPWLMRALELRVLVMDHAARAELLRRTLGDHVPSLTLRVLAREYATERMRMLAWTSPIAVAHERLAATRY
jgi:hypothetical protein